MLIWIRLDERERVWLPRDCALCAKRKAVLLRSCSFISSEDLMEFSVLFRFNSIKFMFISKVLFYNFAL